MDHFAKGEKDILSGIFGIEIDDDESVNEEEEVIADVEEENNRDFLTELVHHSLSRSIEIKLFQQKRKGIAHQLWPAAAHLCNYIEANQDTVFAPTGGVSATSVIELGAGIGLVGLFLSSLGCKKVVLTDLPQAMDILAINIEANSGITHGVEAMPLSWGNLEETTQVLTSVYDSAAPILPPLIVAADCIYWECLFDILAQTLSELCGKGSRVIMSHVKRWKKDSKFFKLCVKKGLMVTVLSESVEYVAHEHTGLPEKTITRIYCIMSKEV